MSTLSVDAITGKSTATTITIGSTPVVSASANSMTIRGEGSAQTSIQQGLCKAWIDFNGTGDVAIRDDLNITGITDNDVSDYTHTIANDFNSANYSFQMEGVYSGSRSYGDGVMGTNFSKAAGSMRTEFMSGNSDQSDLAYVNATHHGDLA